MLHFTLEWAKSLKDELKLTSTKEQLETLRVQTEAYKVQLDSKIDNSVALLDSKIDKSVAQLESKINNCISKLEANILKWFVATVIAIAGIIITAIKFFQ